MSNSAKLDDRGLPPNYIFRDDWEVTPRQVNEMRKVGDDFVLLDCRTTQEYNVARIEGATFMPMQEIATHLEKLRELANEQIIVHCHHGGRSLKVTQFLRENGFSNVKSMAGGIHVWSLDVDDSVPVY